MKKLRLYLDTSVFGGCFDEEFSKDSLKLIERIQKGQMIALVSELVIAEIKRAPEYVQRVLEDIPPNYIERIDLNEGIEKLSAAYLTAGIVTQKSETDAGHVACATFSKADAIVSWNFKHIVQLEKMRLYNQVNAEKRHAFINIVTPREVLGDE